MAHQEDIREERLAHDIRDLDHAAYATRESFGRVPSASRKLADNHARRAAFAAFEAGRGDIHTMDQVRDERFYLLFLVGTVLSPLVVIGLLPTNARPVGWDIVGIASTMLLIGWTYGVYTFKMVVRFFWGILEVLISILFAGVNIPGRSSKTDGDDLGRGDGDATFAFNNLLLCIAGTAASLYATREVIFLYYDRVIQQNQDQLEYNKIYLQFFIAVWFLTLIFIAMDIWIAMNEKSHTEFFIASSSVVHATIPMFLGVTIMGLYLALEFSEARYFEGHDHDTSVRMLSVEFVSGALSFQMILSNVLFIFIKQNRLLRAIYKTIDTTKID